MQNGLSKIMIETIVRKTLREIQESPERSIRNIVDMALQFSKGRFQTHLFEVAQNMLSNENSAYYDIVRQMVQNVDNERIIKFGMNLGYNSCIQGVEQIRQAKGVKPYRIPWTVLFEYSDYICSQNQKRYQELIREGESMGIYTWPVFARNHANNVISLAKKYPNSDFILFMNADELTEELLDRISDTLNVMLMLEYDENADEGCAILRRHRLLYGVFYHYKEADLGKIKSGELLANTEPLNPIVTALIADESCSMDVREQVYKLVLDARISQQYRTLAWELYGDNRFVDGIISGDPIYVSFDEEGYLCKYEGELEKEEIKKCGLINCSLEEILMNYFA